MCGQVAAHEVLYEPTPPGVHEPRPICESGGLRGHQMDDDRMTAHSPDGGFKQSRRYGTDLRTSYLVKILFLRFGL